MFCEQCGTELKEGGLFCISCGHKQGEPVRIQPGQENITGQYLGEQSTPEQAASGIPGFGRSTSYISSTGATGFVEPDEIPLYSLTNGVLNHLITGRGINKDDAILTNKRMYYSHRAGIVNKVSNEEIVDLKDITGTKILNYSPIWLIILAVLGMIVSVCMFASDVPIGGVCGLVVAIVLGITYVFTKDTILSVEYAGGFIEFSMHSYGMQNVRFFQRCIYAAKEVQKTEEFEYIHKVSVVEKHEESVEQVTM